MDGLLGGVGKQLAAPATDFIPLIRVSSAGGVVDDPLADQRAIADDVDRVAGIELALDADDADRQQARPALAQDLGGARVDCDPAAGGLRVAKPELERRRALGMGGKARADLLTRGSGAAASPTRCPSQITAGIPAALAIPAAATLLRMPPEPYSDVGRRSRTRSSSAKSSTAETSSALGIAVGIGRVQARRCR